MKKAGTTTVKAKSSGKRIAALDVMRGMTIALMIVVNNAGGPESYAQLQHSDWNGLTLCDLVFPFFLFIMGVTTYLSLSKSKFKPSGPLFGKIFKRTAVILLICWALHWFDNVCYDGAWLDFGHLRLTGVLTRIALCYCIVSLLALWLSLRQMAVISAVLLLVYGALLIEFHGYNNDTSNVNAVVDRFLLSPDFLYTRRPVDPEGILSTVPAVAHTIIGFCCGYVLKQRRSLDSKLLWLYVFGTTMIIGGLLISIPLPLNKRIWSPSYAVVCCGIAAMLLATLSYFIDKKGYHTEFRFFEWFGVNPLFLYVLAEALSAVLGSTGAGDAIYNACLSVTYDPYMASACYSVSLCLFVAAVAYPLYRKRIYIKI